MIVSIAEHQGFKNDYTCDICSDRTVKVIGRAYTERPPRRYNTGGREYLFSYCAKCALDLSKQLARMGELK